MKIKELLKNPYYRWGFIILLILAFNLLPIPIKKWICVVGLILSPIIPIWGLTKWKKNSKLLNYEWIGLLVIIIVAWALLLYFVGPDFIFSLK
jgi:hypothetical protein